MGVQGMLEPEEAWPQIAAPVNGLAPTVLPLTDLGGQVLAEEVVAEEDVPPFPAATVDGWAVIAADDTAQRQVLSASGIAGQAPALPLAPGTAARVMTGASLPPGADEVVMLEDSGGRGLLLPATDSLDNLGDVDYNYW